MASLYRSDRFNALPDVGRFRAIVLEPILPSKRARPVERRHASLLFHPPNAVQEWPGGG